MIKLSTREAARKLGINYDTLAHYVAVGKVHAPEIVMIGRRTVHIWTEEKIEQVRQLLPKIASGRKTRYKKKADGTKKSAVSKPAPMKRKMKKK